MPRIAGRISLGQAAMVFELASVIWSCAAAKTVQMNSGEVHDRTVGDDSRVR